MGRDEGGVGSRFFGKSVTEASRGGVGSGQNRASRDFSRFPYMKLKKKKILRLKMY